MEKQYIKGFNHGYILAEHDPELAKQIVKHPNNENEYFTGIVSGKQEYDIEKIRLKLKGKSQNKTPQKNITKGRAK